MIVLRDGGLLSIQSRLQKQLRPDYFQKSAQESSANSRRDSADFTRMIAATSVRMGGVHCQPWQALLVMTMAIDS